jgi:hypothetical protein
MLHCGRPVSKVQTMPGAYSASPKQLRKQAERCAALAQQTHDDEGRERYLRLEEMYRRLAETEESNDSNSAAA